VLRSRQLGIRRFSIHKTSTVLPFVRDVNLTHWPQFAPTAPLLNIGIPDQYRGPSGVVVSLDNEHFHDAHRRIDDARLAKKQGDDHGEFLWGRLNGRVERLLVELPTTTFAWRRARCRKQYG